MTAWHAARALAVCSVVACAPATAPPAPRAALDTAAPSPSGPPRWLAGASSSDAPTPAPLVAEDAAEPAGLPDESPSDPRDTPFGRYVRAIHRRLHPEFSGRVLAALDRLGASHPLADPSLEALVELALTADGRIAYFGLSHTSGASDFDVGVVESIQRASPFPKPPPALLSRDGLFHVEWRFSRDPAQACGPGSARAQ